MLLELLDMNHCIFYHITFGLRLGYTEHAEASLSRDGFESQFRAYTVPHQAEKQQISHPEEPDAQRKQLSPENLEN